MWLLICIKNDKNLKISFFYFFVWLMVKWSGSLVIMNYWFIKEILNGIELSFGISKWSYFFCLLKNYMIYYFLVYFMDKVIGIINEFVLIDLNICFFCILKVVGERNRNF